MQSRVDVPLEDNTYNGPAKSIPVFAKGGASLTLLNESSGSFANDTRPDYTFNDLSSSDDPVFLSYAAQSVSDAVVVNRSVVFQNDKLSKAMFTWKENGLLSGLWHGRLIDSPLTTNYVHFPYRVMANKWSHSSVK